MKKSKKKGKTTEGDSSNSLLNQEDRASSDFSEAFLKFTNESKELEQQKQNNFSSEISTSASENPQNQEHSNNFNSSVKIESTQITKRKRGNKNVKNPPPKYRFMESSPNYSSNTSEFQLHVQFLLISPKLIYLFID